MSNTYFKAMSVMGCEIGGITRRSLCRHNCCDGENCVTWLEKQFAKLNDEYEEAKADGRLVVLPCKPGDTIYRLDGLQSWQIVSITIYPDEIIFMDDSDNIFGLDNIGKTIFFTQEEAEKALGGGGDA